MNIDLQLNAPLRSFVARRPSFVAVLTCALVGCSSESVFDDAPILGSSAELIAGFAAGDPALDAIGTMSLMYTDPYSGNSFFELVCSGALIDSNTALSTKHCVNAVSYLLDYPEYKLVFTLGPSQSAPTRWVEVIATEGAPGDSGGFTGYGHDVAVLHLAEKIANVTPLGIEGITSADLGQNFVAIGYGAQDNRYTEGTRRIGKVQLKANRGRTFEALLGSFEAFFIWYTGQQPPTDCDQPSPSNPYLCSELSYLRQVYDTTVLEPTDDVVVGGAQGDAQPCYGDSGSPLMKSVNGRLYAYGVVNGGISSSKLICDHGGVYASFGPSVLDFLRTAMRWRDPCHGLSRAGICAGTVAQRCTKWSEGERRETEFDCADVGLSCEIQADGTAGCGSVAPPVSSVDAGVVQGTRDAGAVQIARGLDVRGADTDTFIRPGQPLPGSAAQAASIERTRAGGDTADSAVAPGSAAPLP